MKHLRWVSIIAVMLLWVAAASAQTPPDGSANLKGGGKSTAITGQGQSFSFSTCAGAMDPDVIADCAAAGNSPQAVFGGINETGDAWSSLSVVLNLVQNPSDPDLFVSCTGGSIFTVFAGGCNEALSPTQTTVTLIFEQGTGTGIGCYNGSDPTQAATNAACQTNGFNTLQNNILGHTTNPYTNPSDVGDASCPGLALGEVCGPNEFLISLGGTNSEGTSTNWNSVPLSGTIYYNPEPPTFLLVGGAMLAMLFLGFKKTRTVLA